VARVRRSGSRLVTTDYVVDETCTLLKARLGSVGAARLLDLLGGTAALNWQWIGPERF
jgi:predicted nucleic acid-binding protein